MIGSHDSFTYLDSTSNFMNLITRFWRCQNKNIIEQYNFGVRYFDVRVVREVDSNGKNIWRLCHGQAELTKTFKTIQSICAYFIGSLKGSIFELWLEKGNEDDWNCFKDEALPLTIKYNCIAQIVRKNPETIIYRSPNFPQKISTQFNNWNLRTIIKNLFSSPIKNNAKKYNPKITQEMINNPNINYFMDYI